MKQCNICKEFKELAEFYNNKKSADGKQYRCKGCSNTDKKYMKEWKRKNKTHRNAYERNRRKSDPAFAILGRLRSRLYALLNGNKSTSTIDLLGCTAKHARLHIENQFTEGMTWDNIHIDHIQPCASFDLEDPNEQRKCFHYTNLQPLLAEDNLRKSDQIVPEHQVRLL